MSTGGPPLEDVVTPTGSAEGVALWHAVSDFMTSGGDQAEPEAFNRLALQVFRFQFQGCALYNKWCRYLGWSDADAASVGRWQDIPTMPVEAFRWGQVQTEGIAENRPPVVFRTSGTTGADRGTHRVLTPGLYRTSATVGFSDRFGPPGDGGAVVLGLLPGYLERPDSSLVHMVTLLREQGWMEAGGHPAGGFFLDNVEALFEAMGSIQATGRTVVLIGVTWALVDAAEAWKRSGRPPLTERVHIAITGGMKGRREEWVSERVRSTIQRGFGCRTVAGEYGMTELLSQAWSLKDGLYETPPWMRIRIRRTDDALSINDSGATGGVDVIDLANLASCSFLSTQDLARPSTPKIEGIQAFELLGRFDRSEVRGCNLLVD
ncbi:MAG: acyl transferase [Flavobacteriales bacterium]|nr:acyl transferase [Flavobacteriales bacterium]